MREATGGTWLRNTYVCGRRARVWRTNTGDDGGIDRKRSASLRCWLRVRVFERELVAVVAAGAGAVLAVMVAVVPALEAMAPAPDETACDARREKSGNDRDDDEGE